MPTTDFIQVTSLAASTTPRGNRVDTLLLRYPRIIHAEFMTHRVMSKSASSSRAIPVKKLRIDDAYVPQFGQNQPGMQAKGPVSAKVQLRAEDIWLRMADACREGVAELEELGIHKQHANRPLEWFGYIDVVVTAEEWNNFFTLRDHDAAQPEIRELALKILAERNRVAPFELRTDQWHLPFIDGEAQEDAARFSVDHPRDDVFGMIDFAFARLSNLPLMTRLLLVMSAARCARASYRDFDGSKANVERDVGTFMKLVGSHPVHATPLEHQVRPTFWNRTAQSGNLIHFEQFRKFIPAENVPG